MANVKITQLPAVGSVTTADVLPVVASSTTSQLSILDLANSLPQVTSSISASYAVSASYALSASFEIVYETSSSYADFAMTASYVETAQTASYYNFTGTNIISSSTFPFSGSAQITGSLGVTGSLSILSGSINLFSSSFQSSILIGSSKGLMSGYIYPANISNLDWRSLSTEIPAFPYFYPAASNIGSTTDFVNTWYFRDINFGQNLNSLKAGVLKFSRNAGTTVPNVEFFTLVSSGNSISDFTTGWQTANGRDHTLTVTGSILSKDGVTLGTNISNQHYLTGSLRATGSLFQTGEIQVTGSTNLLGALNVEGTGSLNSINVTNLLAGNLIFGTSYFNTSQFPDVFNGPSYPAFPMIWGTLTGYSNSAAGGFTYNYEDKNIGHLVPSKDTGNIRAGSIKFVRDVSGTSLGTGGQAGTATIPYFTIITNNASIDESNLSNAFVAANGRNHVLTVTGSILSKDGVTLGTDISNQHYLTGSLTATGSLTWTGFTILTTVSQSLNFVDDTAAAAGGVPLGGLYRNGNIVCIRIS